MHVTDRITQDANRKNLLQLIYLRMAAIIGQFATVLIVHSGLGIKLPLKEMLWVIIALSILNLLTWLRYRFQPSISAAMLFVELLVDVGALTLLLYLSGGASNPFISLFLLQVTIGAVLLRPIYAWVLLGATLGCYLLLTFYYLPLQHVGHYHLGEFFNMHIHGMMMGYTICALLLLFFLTTISRNLRERDASLAAIKQQLLEEEHILRMGLLATGAAHELGTPLTTISVILKDWQNFTLPESPQAINEDIQTMQTEVERCKTIVSGILLSSGEVRGEGTEIIMLHQFLNDIALAWQQKRNPPMFLHSWEGMENIAIISDKVLCQIMFTILDNALDASPERVEMTACIHDEILMITIEDQGGGFDTDILARFGKPYTSSKQGSGHGMGLFLAVNTLRKLGGHIHAENKPDKGCKVAIALPLSAIRIPE